MTARRTTCCSVALLTIAIVMTFGPVVRNNFTDWDDPDAIWANPHLHPATLSNVGWYWKHSDAELYIPVTYTVWGGLTHLGQKAEPNGTMGPDPAIFHAASVATHLLSSIVVLLIIRRFVKNDWAACAGALVFALHPVQAETISWAAGYKDLLCGFFVLTAAWQYLAWRDDHRRWRYAIALIAMVLGMLSKPTAVITPLLLVAIDPLLHQGTWRASLRSVWPFVVLAIPCIIWTHVVQPESVSASAAFWARPLIAGDAIAFYLEKLLLPINLAIDYGRDPATALATHWIWFKWTIPAFLIVLAYRLRFRINVLPVALAIFVIGILPVLGFIPFEFETRSTVADHYLYLSMLGIGIFAAWLVARWNHRVVFYASAIVLAALAMRSLDQTRHWHDSRALFAHAIEVNPRSYDATQNLAVLCAFDAETSAQTAQLLRAQNDPDEARTIARMKASFAEAERLLARVLELKPGSPFALHTRAGLRSHFGEHDQAIADLETLVQELPTLRPDEQQAFMTDYNLLAREYLKVGQREKAIACYDAMLKLRPDDRAAVRGRENALAQDKRVTPAAVGPTTVKTLYSHINEEEE